MARPKEGSRKAAIYDIFMSEGLEAALAHAATIDIKPGTVKSWSGGWKGAAAPIKQKGAQGAPATTRGEFSPHFKYSSRALAERALAALATRSGAQPRAFHILEEKEHFAVVPAAYKPGGPIPQFKKGDVVYDTVIPDNRGTINEAGPEQCEVKYPGNRLIIVPNVYLYRHEGKPETKERVRIEKKKGKK